MSEPRILIIDKIEDLYEDKGNVPNPVIGKLVSDSAGNQLKVKVGRGGHLKNKWDELLIGRAYSFKMGEFKGYPFVEDFEEVKDIFVKEAAEKVRDSGAESRTRSYALAYAKDLAVADRIKTGDILTYADWFNAWLTIGFKVEKPIEEPGQPPLAEPGERQSPITPKLNINMDWLSESIKKIWGTYKAFVQFLGERYSVAKDGSVKDVLERLSEKQQAELLKEIEGKLKEI